ncbi:fagellar hook-basal body protein [Denitrovibrio acetiphilus DSM 12809]|uniref:Fagellar hook-basal body protein n=1 Tax=Denitrovibrio acetiphilus (strain DSM 12809 / NBRC 114555 / N2460) TaxID=522772 RepID=D4H6Z9_DENA2|nr:flagellar hook-basal body complex protein [Denitrovibrio acetiphilus]ADD67865.1 fagellar hook-basal body protein [Denitrovibrio acetiphilus DSM 12809]
MMQGLYTGANAISVYKNSLINTANNVANINTPYFKSNTLQLNEMEQGGVSISSIRQNQDLSYTISSGRTLDFVIDGSGQFRLEDNNGTSYTRNGVFYLDAEGDVVDSGGRKLLEDVVKPGESAESLSVGEDGSFTVDGEFRGKIDVYDSYGNKIPENLYMLRSGMLEVSDVDYAREVVDMIVTKNAFSANTSSVRTYDDMLGLIVNLVG